MITLCQVIFSTNRPEYLARTLVAQQLLDTSGCMVEKILIDDFPKGRDDAHILDLAHGAGYDEVYLHDRNLSIGATWQECWNLIRDRDYDYVWHQEDDVEILEPISMLDLIDVLERTPLASQVVLKRQPWYAHEAPARALETDLILGHYRGEFGAAKYFFTPIASLYPIARVRFDYKGWFRTHHEPIFHAANINEALIGKALAEAQGLTSLHLKNAAGGNLIRHIGEYTVGQKLLPHEPGYALFAGMDPEVKYRSGTRERYEEQPV